MMKCITNESKEQNQLNFGEWVHRNRIGRSWDLKTLALKTELSRTTIVNIEKNRSQGKSEDSKFLPNIDTVKKICTIFGEDEQFPLFIAGHSPRGIDTSKTSVIPKLEEIQLIAQNSPKAEMVRTEQLLREQSGRLIETAKSLIVMADDMREIIDAK